MIIKLSGLLGRRKPAHPSLRLGYLATVDAALLLVARAQGFFEQEGLDVSLSRQTSWHRSRAKIAAGELHGAHMPGTAPLCASLGIGGDVLPLRTAFVLSLGGSSFGLHARWLQALQDAGLGHKRVTPAQSLQALAVLVAQRRQQGQSRLRLAVTDLYSNGSYELRYALASVGIDPLEDVELVAITPSRVLRSLREGNYDGAWLDEPWGSLAADEGLVSLLFSKQAFWNHSLGKVLALPEEFLQRHPLTHRALLRALMRAAIWLETHRAEALPLLAARDALNQPESALQVMTQGIPTLAGASPDDLVFHSGAANFPWYSQAVWYLGQMIRWGDFSDVLDFKLAAQEVYLPRLYREAARELNAAYPNVGYKNEGEHAEPWELEQASQPLLMGPDMFFDGRTYNPRQTMKYLNALDISHISAPLDAMWAIR